MIKLPRIEKIAVAIIGSFFLVQIISVLISQLFPQVPILKGGSSILLMLLAIGIMSLFIIGTNVDQLRKKESLIFILIVFVGIGLVYWKLPEQFPDLFSISPDISNTIKQTIGSIVG